MSFRFTPSHFLINPYTNTENTTLGPVPSGQPFYQEAQSKKKCVIHSMNAFAGRHVVDLTAYVEISNRYLIEQYKTVERRDELNAESLAKDVYKQYNWNIDDLEKNGLYGTEALKEYMEKNKDRFNLPLTSHIILAHGKDIGEDAIEKSLRTIEVNPRLHRVILSLNTFGFAHQITFRKDDSGLWRMIDSMTVAHRKEALDEVEKIQPSFGTLKEAIQNAIKLYLQYTDCSKLLGLELMYPSKDTPVTTLKIAESSGLPLSISNLIHSYAKPKRESSICTIS